MTDQQSIGVLKYMGERISQVHRVLQRLDDFAMHGGDVHDEKDLLDEEIESVLKELVVTTSLVLERLQLPVLLGSFREDIGKYSANLSKSTTAAFGGLTSPALGVVWRYHSAIAVFLGLDRDTILPEQECHLLQRIIRNTSKIIYDSQIPPSNEAAVRQRVYDILIHVFPDTVREVPICQVTKTYKPDIGIPSLKSAIEYKFADSQAEVKKAIGGLYEDMRGYAGSEDWKRFYAVVYMTDPFFTEEQIRAEFKHVNADDCWFPILIVGQGSRKRTSAKAKKA
jgi:hypothetical protein